MRQDAFQRFLPLVKNIEYEAAVRAALELKTSLDPSRLTSDIRRGSVTKTNEMVDRVVEGLKRQLQKVIQDAEWNGVAIGVVIASLLSNINKKRLAIGVTTDSITHGELTATQQINDSLRLRENNFVFRQSEAELSRRTPSPQGVGNRPRDFISAKIEVVSYWQTQQDAKVCKICDPLHNRRLRDLPAEFQSCLLYTSPSPRDQRGSRMPCSA